MRQYYNIALEGDQEFLDLIKKATAKYYKLRIPRAIKAIFQENLNNPFVIYPETGDKIKEFCSKRDKNVNDFINDTLLKKINSDAQKQNKIHGSTTNALDELKALVMEAIEYYKSKPANERKYITKSLITRFLIIHKKPQKSHKILKEFFKQEHDFINQYHLENNLINYERKHL